MISLELESKLRGMGLWPRNRTAWAALYVLALDLLLFAAQWLTHLASPGTAESLEGWIIFLSALAIVLFISVGFRWLRSKLLWRLRNRLIVTYVFIGVIPVFLLLVISLTTLYLLAGQFASFVVTSDIATHLHSLESANRAIAHHLATGISTTGKVDANILSRARPNRPEWSPRQVCASYGNQSQPYCSTTAAPIAFNSPASLTGDFREIIRDHDTLFLRTGTTVMLGPDPLRVVLSEPLDQEFLAKIAADLGRIVVYDESPSSIMIDRQGGAKTGAAKTGPAKTNPAPPDPKHTFSSGTMPLAANALDPVVRFPIPLQVVDWATGERHRAGALAEVETRPSVLYARLFAALGDYARGVEYILLSIALVFAIIELLALFVGTKLTRSITSAVAQLYEATKHINRGDFSHRITVESSDQLATLANSFNSMTTSIEALIQEQKEKQRLEGELAIAQEVQAQLYPKLITQLDTLEVHGFCRPARTVSGDYYDFLALNSDKLMLAVGDISGKGISAALLMATIHSAIRAYSVEGVPVLSETVSVGASHNSGLLLASESRVAEASPATLLTLLNHQLYESTPAAKYATLFLGAYDEASRQLTYSNGGHLPPILISEDGSSQLLSCGGTVIGLFDNLSFPEATVRLRPGDLLVAYSDGITEPENDYGEFGEERLIQLVRANRHLPLERITEIVTGAVHDWIGDNEQPDDITLVLARAR
jgi:sigma-B regulation protein RsbU (phosphoserine phosphatase)